MKKIGLALSGGGFRATLFHLGLIRFLRDAGLLTQVTHITSVSGGSIIAAHLVLNWKRYTGSESDFDEAAKELVAFTQLDVRNRILRRFPLAALVAIGRRLLGRSNRKLTRAGLLEDHYQKLLYGDASLFELPKTPKLHVLATNLSEGCLCSFHRDGLLVARRGDDRRFHIENIRVGLATVPMAVAASSAFPGFFPPLELSDREVGLTGGEFGKQAYTDGGVYDNLGIRMFRFLDRQILVDDQLSRDDFLDLKSAFDALRAASISPERTALRRLAEVLEHAEKSQDDTPLHRLAVVLEEAIRNPALFELTPAAPPDPSTASAPSQHGNCVDQLLARLWEVMCHYQFQHEPLFSGLKPLDPAASEFLKESHVGAYSLEMGSQFWLNRHLLEAAFREATGQGCFRRLNTGLDGVIVSDVGRQIQVVKDHSGGFLRSALRASDILMDRVWQLENETFKASSEFVFARVSDIVTPEEDPTAPHPEIQRLLTAIRTDLDQFSDLEIGSLVRHGYCVCRRVCQSRPDLFGSNLPLGVPWDPLPTQETAAQDAKPAAGRERTSVTTEARQLQASSLRRVWSRLFDWRDWVSFVYVPIIVPLLLCLPYISLHYYQRMVRLNHLTLSYAQGSPDVTELDRILEEGPPPKWKGVPIEDGRSVTDMDLSGFKVLCDSRITDLRNWTPPVGDKTNPDSYVYVYRRLSVLKKPETQGTALFHVRLILLGEGEARFPAGQTLQGRVVKNLLEDNTYRWDAIFDFTRTPPGTPVDLVIELQAPGAFLKGSNSTTGMSFAIEAETAELAQWVLMPKRRDYKNFRYVYYKKGEPETAKEGSFYTRYLAEDHSILAFKILAMDPGYEHEIFWNYQ